MTGVNTHYNGTRYMYSVYQDNDAIITITRGDTTKTVRVGYEAGMRYQLRRSAINCCDGAHGLYKWLQECFAEHFCECLAYKVMDYAIDKMRAV